MTFKLPDKANARAVAPYAAGVNILGMSQEPKTFIYHFDNDGKLIAQHPVTSDLDDIMIATTSSGITILVGHHLDKDGESGYGGLVLDAADRIVSRFAIPPPPDGGAWNFGEWNSLSDHFPMTAVRLRRMNPISDFASPNSNNRTGRLVRQLAKNPHRTHRPRGRGF